MSTRANIYVIGTDTYKLDDNFELFLEIDGYPTWALEKIAEALSIAKRKLDVTNENGKYDFPLTSSSVVGNIIGTTTSGYNMTCSFHNIGKFDKSDLYAPSYIVWQYVINLKDKEITIHKNSEEIVNPVDYIQELYEECQEGEKKLILKHVKDLENLGFKVN